MIQRPAISGFLHSAKNVPQTRAPIIAPFFLSEFIGRGVVFGRNFFGAVLHAELHAKIGAKSWRQNWRQILRTNWRILWRIFGAKSGAICVAATRRPKRWVVSQTIGG